MQVVYNSRVALRSIQSGLGRVTITSLKMHIKNISVLLTFSVLGASIGELYAN